MRGIHKIQRFHQRHPRVGPVFYIASIQFFITQLVVALFWPVHYSLSNNTISDLGNSVCGIYSSRYVCSPAYSWMNASFMILGITMIGGSALLYHQFRKSAGTAVGFSLIGAAGFGTLLVGLFPENTIGFLHSLGAFLPFFLGNIALIVLGLSLELKPAFRVYTIISGVVSLIAFALFISHQYFYLGVGGMERFTAHPQTIWLIIFGIYLSGDSDRAQKILKK
jgi:hypothetical membrane protein